MIYFDTSALVKRYVKEAAKAERLKILNPQEE